MSIPVLLDDKWSKSLNKECLTGEFPFSHLILDEFLEEQRAKSLVSAFPNEDSSWISYIHYNERKYGLSERSKIANEILTVIDELNSPNFLKWLGNQFGIIGLVADTDLNGGGLHLMPRNSFLNIHTDFNVHPKIHHLKRRLNLILFLNENWKEEYNGALEFWKGDMSVCAKTIMPDFNKCVIFETNNTSFHGCPEPIKCPDNMSRKSIALYYYTYENKKPRKRFTNYRSTKSSLVHKSLVYLDKKLVHLYSHIKYNGGLNDSWISKLLRIFK